MQLEANIQPGQSGLVYSNTSNAASTAKRFDQPGFIARTGENSELSGIIAESFLGDAPDKIIELKEAIGRRDASYIQRRPASYGRKPINGRGNPMSERRGEAFRVGFDRSVKIEFQGPHFTSDAGLLAFQDSDEALGLTGVAVEIRTDTRTGRNTRHGLAAQHRQSVYSRLAG